MATCDLQNAEAVFTYSSSSILHIAIFGTVLLIIGIIFFNNRLKSIYFSNRINILGAFLCLFGVVILVLGAPTMHSERIVLTPLKICTSYGLWFHIKSEQVTYSEIDYILETKPPKENWRDPITLEIFFKNGKSTPFNRSDLWANNEMTISELLKKHSIELREQSY